MHLFPLIGLVFASSWITGCSAIQRGVKQGSFAVAAVEIDPKLIAPGVQLDPSSYPPKADGGAAAIPPPSGGVTPDPTKAYLGFVVQDSMEKCADFVNGLVLTSTSVNTSLDIVNTLLSGLATVFTPIATIHALTAAATIVGGWKGAINSDIYAKASIANYAQAIQASYYTDISKYLTALSAAPAGTLVASSEVPKIQLVHKECSLATAQSTISSTLQAATPTSETNLSASIDINKVPPAGTQVSLTATASTLTGSPVTIDSYTTQHSDTAATIASAVTDKLNSDTTLKGAKITASATGSRIAVSWPTSIGSIDWSGSPANVFKVSVNQAVTPAAELRVAVPPKGVTPAAIPGSSLQSK